jgi:hypothetical protein
MTTTTTDQGIIVPLGSDLNDMVTALAQLLGSSTVTPGLSGTGGVESRLIKRYLSAADRAARNPTPATNEVTIRADNPGILEYYTGAAWVQVGQQLPARLMAAPKTTVTNGTVTSGLTETRDDILGTYVFTGVSGRFYRVTYANLIGNGTAADLYNVRIRDGGASTPTAGSPLLAETAWVPFATGGAGRTPIPLSDVFQVSSGVHTIATFGFRSTGSGAFTATSPAANGGSMPRSLYVEDIT